MNIKANELSNDNSVRLEDDFRDSLFKHCVDKSGSLYRLGRDLGYMGVTPSWNVKQMWYGKQYITVFRLKKLAQIAGIPFEEIIKHITQIKKSR